MRVTTRPILAVFLTVLTVLTSVASAPAAARRPAGLDWKPCTDDRTAQCATLRVPVDWDDPYGRENRRRRGPPPGHRPGAPDRHAGGQPRRPGRIRRRLRARRRHVLQPGPARPLRHRRLRPARRRPQQPGGLLGRADRRGAVAAARRRRRSTRAAIAYNRRLAADCRERHRTAVRSRRHDERGPGHGRAAGRARRGEAHLLRRVVRHADRRAVRRPVPAAGSGRSRWTA